MLGFGKVGFRCNVCGSECRVPHKLLGREDASCQTCRSSVRMRAIVHLVSETIYGESLALPEFPSRPDIRGVGLSDWEGYAKGLAQRVSYTNTYYHQDPQLDITRVPEAMQGSCDFVVSTDVFEHVCPPVSLAFEGARKLLKPGGSLIMSVPYVIEWSQTREHFPELHRFEVRQDGDGVFRLYNERKDGTHEVFEDLVFHGGAGETLEMRIFCRESLLRELEQAGFSNVRIFDQAVPKWGIEWKRAWSLPLVATAP